VGFLVAVLLKMYSWFWQWKKDWKVDGCSLGFNVYSVVSRNDLET